MWPRAIIHVDCDAFFASCEQAMHPEYRGKPVITGAERGIVAAASYEAKARGVSRGVPLWEVKKIIPDAIIVPSDYESYSIFSERMFTIMRRFSNDVEEYSIDEAFAEVTEVGSRRSEVGIARAIKHTIQRELGITVSVGISLSKVLAKIGSKFQKPDGFTVITAENLQQYLAQTPLENIWGIGPATSAHAKQFGITTAFDFARKEKSFIESHFDKPYQVIWYELNGVSVMPVDTTPKTDYQSISKTRTFTPPSTDPSFVYAQLLKNLENACIKARRHELVAHALIVYLKRQDFRSSALETTLARASAYPHDMTESLRAMFQKLLEPRTAYRATGVVLTELTPRHLLQRSLFESPEKIDKLARAWQSVDILARKFGKHIIHLAGSQRAHINAQHTNHRGLITERKTHRLQGESSRLHLSIPVHQSRTV